MNLHNKALLIIDMINDFVLDGAPLKVPGIEKIIEPIKMQIKKAREEKYPVVYICDSHDENDKEFKLYPPHAIKDTKGAEIIDQLKPQIQDKIIYKKTFSGFYKTELEDFLLENNIKRLIITGCVANICVLYTVSDAVLRGFDVVVIKDAIIGLNSLDYEFAIRQMREVLKVEIN